LIVIVDSNLVGYKSKYTQGFLSHGDKRTGVIFGFLDTVLKISYLFNTNNLVFAWDSRKSNREYLYYSEYKKGAREKIKKEATKEEKREMRYAHEQFRELRLYTLPKLGFKNVFMQVGYEADDIMASVAEFSTEKVVIYSDDHDMLQCLNGHVEIYMPRSKKIVTQNDIIKEKDILPHIYGMVLAISGCRTDNVPSVTTVGKGTKVGEKTAIKYLNNKLPVDSAQYQLIISKKGSKFIARNAFLTCLPFEGTKVFELQKNNFSAKKFRNIFSEYGFKSFLKQETWLKWMRQFCQDDIPF